MNTGNANAMENKTTTTPDTTNACAFGKPERRWMPSKACLGYISEVRDGKETASGDYIWQSFRITGTNGSPDAFPSINYRLDWLKAGFKPSDLKEVKNGDKFYGQYCRHIFSDTSQYSTLRGLCASEPLFNELAARLVGLGITGTDEAKQPEEIRAVSETLRTFFTRDYPGQKIGYILKQKTEKVETGETKDDGTPVYEYVPVEGYEVGGFFSADEKGITGITKRAAKSVKGTKNHLLIGFDSTPF